MNTKKLRPQAVLNLKKHQNCTNVQTGAVNFFLSSIHFRNQHDDNKTNY